ncbi:hypothetical protein [uncultured Thermomonospora sp.]|uniref:hypothetical protein n=1 Tax=uncultured Thermomonospora sp. TaxID=671175 RepID=UPI00259B89B7|nr:hypothetical protein [uncultured Thermomonospora sp.]
MSLIVSNQSTEISALVCRKLNGSARRHWGQRRHPPIKVGGPRWSPHDDTRPWIKFCLRAHHIQAQQAKRRVDLLGRAWIALAEAVTGAGLEERTAFALLPAFWGSRVRRTIYQQDAELSEQQAIRDIRDLCRLGRLTPQGQARGRHYTAGPAMQPILEKIKSSMKPFEDPYRGRGV